MTLRLHGSPSLAGPCLEIRGNVGIGDHPDVPEFASEAASATEDADSGRINAESFGGLCSGQ